MVVSILNCRGIGGSCIFLLFHPLIEILQTKGEDCDQKPHDKLSVLGLYWLSIFRTLNYSLIRIDHLQRAAQ